MAIDSTKKSSRFLQSRRYTHDTFTDAQEAFTSVLDINSNEVYLDSNLIPSASLPFSGSSQSGSIYSVGGQNVLKYYYRQKLTKSDLNNEVWFFTLPTGSSSGIGAQLIDNGQQGNFVSPKYSVSSLTNANTEDATPGYGVKVLINTIQQSVNSYAFDYKTGVLQFSSSAAAPTGSQVVYVTAYQYVGRTLASYQTGSFTGSFTGSLVGTSSYAATALTASHALTASSADNFLVRGTLTVQTVVAQTVTSSISFITGSSRFGSLNSNQHQFTGSVLITGSLNVDELTVNLSALITGSLTVTGSLFTKGTLFVTGSNNNTLFLIKNYQNQNIFEVKQNGIINVATQSVTPFAISASAGDIYFTSSSMYVGLE